MSTQLLECHVCGAAEPDAVLQICLPCAAAVCRACSQEIEGHWYCRECWDNGEVLRTAMVSIRDRTEAQIARLRRRWHEECIPHIAAKRIARENENGVETSNRNAERGNGDACLVRDVLFAIAKQKDKR